VWFVALGEAIHVLKEVMAAKSIQSLAKGIDILFLFTEDCPLLTVEKIASKTGIPKSTCYRFLNTLRTKKMVDLDPSSGKYRLGVHILELESVVTKSLNVSQIAVPFLTSLCSVSGETAQLVVLAGDKGVCVETVESPHALRVMPNKGTEIGLHSGAAGKIILCYLNPQEQERVIRVTQLPAFTRNTITDAVRLREQLREIKEQGYAVTEEEIYAGVKAIAAPIFDHRKKVVASVCVAGPMDRLTDEKTKRLIGHVVAAAQNITELLRGSLTESTAPRQLARHIR
jgi:DNA-binding IclR family transcriptional regulator